MAFYKIKVQEINYGQVEIKAESYEEACEKVYDAVLHGECYWFDGELVIEEVEEMVER